jgi:di/tricarboxylate transporter
VTWEAWYTLVVAVITMAILAKNWLPPAGAMVTAMVAILAPGGYRFGDYLRFGVSLTVISFIGIVAIVPLKWPL